jgi:hypothetical protein
MTEGEKMASMGWPVTEELAAVAGVPIFSLHQDNKWHTRVGNAMMLPFIGTGIVCALACLHFRKDFRPVADVVPVVIQSMDPASDDAVIDVDSEVSPPDDFLQIPEFGEEVVN